MLCVCVRGGGGGGGGIGKLNTLTHNYLNFEIKHNKIVQDVNIIKV